MHKVFLWLARFVSCTRPICTCSQSLLLLARVQQCQTTTQQCVTKCVLSLSLTIYKGHTLYCRANWVKWVGSASKKSCNGITTSTESWHLSSQVCRFCIDFCRTCSFNTWLVIVLEDTTDNYKSCNYYVQGVHNCIYMYMYS